MASNKPNQILQLTPPNEIVFNGPFDRVVTSYLELQNPSFQRVCFKVKTTAPRRYCVRPNSGIVEPGLSVKIAIMLQPVEQEIQTERSKHKFMVQSTILLTENSNLDSVWQDVPQESIMDSKLRCVFEWPTNTDESKAATVTTAATTTTTSTTATIPETVTTTSSTIKNATATTNKSPVTNSTTQQSTQQMTGSQKHAASATAGDGQNTSKPKESRSFASSPSTSLLREFYANDADKSVASSNNLTASFLQPMSDDYKIVLVSLVMLIVGVILGKYII